MSISIQLIATNGFVRSSFNLFMYFSLINIRLKIWILLYYILHYNNQLFYSMYYIIQSFLLMFKILIFKALYPQFLNIVQSDLDQRHILHNVNYFASSSQVQNRDETIFLRLRIILYYEKNGGSIKHIELEMMFDQRRQKTCCICDKKNYDYFLHFIALDRAYFVKERV